MTVTTKSIHILLFSLFIIFSMSGNLGAEPEKAKDELVLAIGGESADGYDPMMGWGRYGASLFQSTLLKRGPDMSVAGDLATSWTLDKSGTVWTINLRKDVRFSDGKPLTAKDVAFTFNTAATSGGKVDLSYLKRADVVGDYTVSLSLKHRRSTFINILVSLGIVPEHQYNPGTYARNPLGSGPYTLIRWDEGQQMVVEVNPLYYGEKPGIRRIVFLFVKEDTAFAAAKAGKVQMAVVPQSMAVNTIRGMKLYAVRSVDNRGVMFPYVPDTGKKTESGYPVGNAVTSDPAIRKAINYAIDRQALVNGVLEGFGTVAHGPVSHLPWEERETVIRDNDLEASVTLLNKAGWIDKNRDGIREKNGIKAEFTLLYPAHDSTRQALALMVAEMVKPTGIRIRCEGKIWDEIRKLQFSNAVLFGWGSYDQTEIYHLYHSSQQGLGYNNPGFYANKTIDNYIDLAMGAPSFEEANVFWKAAQWNGLQGFTAKGDAAWAWLVNLSHTYYVDKRLDIGTPMVEPHGHGWPITTNITSWKWLGEES